MKLILVMPLLYLGLAISPSTSQGLGVIAVDKKTCLQVQTAKVSVKQLESYIQQTTPIAAILFTAKNKKELCADPKMGWVKNAIIELDKRAKNLSIKKAAPNNKKSVKKAAPNNKKSVKKAAPNNKKSVKKAAPNNKKSVKKAAPNNKKSVKKAASNNKKAAGKKAKTNQKTKTQCNKCSTPEKSTKSIMTTRTLAVDPENNKLHILPKKRK